LFKRVLFPVSLREKRKQIINLVDFLTNFETEEIVLLHVQSSGVSSKGHAQSKLNELKELLKEYSFKISTEIVRGHDATEIVNRAEANGIDFICFSWKRKSPLQRVLLGSTTKDVIRLSRIPVFVYKSLSILTSSDNTMNRVLYASDFEQSDNDIIPYLKTNSLRANELYILHVGMRAPDIEAENQRQKRVNIKLEELKEKCLNSFKEIKTISKVGNSRKIIVKQARKNNIDLILMGKHDAPARFSRILGTNAEYVSHHSNCSLLIIPQKV
jgi:nucleotide-binding universal stress UspA family protein